MERIVLVKQEIRQAHGNKLMRNKKVIELATGKLMEESDEETNDINCEFEMKMDKDTWQYFKSQH